MEYLKDNVGFKRLYETEDLLLGHVYEAIVLYNKQTRKESNFHDFDSTDATCGIIGENSDWAAVGAEVLVIWTPDDVIVINELEYIYDMKLVDDYILHVLTDPFDSESAIWQLEIDPEDPVSPVVINKVRDFSEYYGLPYEDKIAW